MPSGARRKQRSRRSDHFEIIPLYARPEEHNRLGGIVLSRHPDQTVCSVDAVVKCRGPFTGHAISISIAVDDLPARETTLLQTETAKLDETQRPLRAHCGGHHRHERGLRDHFPRAVDGNVVKNRFRQRTIKRVRTVNRRNRLVGATYERMKSPVAFAWIEFCRAECGVMNTDDRLVGVPDLDVVRDRERIGWRRQFRRDDPRPRVLPRSRRSMDRRRGGRPAVARPATRCSP